MLHGINMVILVVDRRGRINMERVRLVHGNGGRFSHELTDRFILKYFTNNLLAPLHDVPSFLLQPGAWLSLRIPMWCNLRSFLVVILASWLFVEL